MPLFRFSAPAVCSMVDLTNSKQSTRCLFVSSDSFFFFLMCTWFSFVYGVVCRTCYRES